MKRLIKVFMTVLLFSSINMVNIHGEESAANAASKPADKSADKSQKSDTSLINKIFLDVDYSNFDSYIAPVVSGNFPISGSSVADKLGIGVGALIFAPKIAAYMGLDYIHNLEGDNDLHSVLLNVDYARRFKNFLAWYAGVGIGLRFDASNDENSYRPKGYNITGPIALKIDTGVILSYTKYFAKVGIGYDNVMGLSIGAGLGFGVLTLKK